MAERQRDFEKDRYMGAQALAPPVDIQVGGWLGEASCLMDVCLSVWLGAGMVIGFSIDDGALAALDASFFPPRRRVSSSSSINQPTPHRTARWLAGWLAGWRRRVSPSINQSTPHRTLAGWLAGWLGAVGGAGGPQGGGARAEKGQDGAAGAVWGGVGR